MSTLHPTCPKHGLLKPCQHCEPTRYADEPMPNEVLKTCGDIDQGDEFVLCECGSWRSKLRKHGYTRLSGGHSAGGFPFGWPGP